MTQLRIFQNSEDAKSFPAGQTIYREGDDRDGMYVVLEGEVAITIKGKVIDRIGPGGIFGEIALIERGKRLATATTATDCRLVAVSEKRFLFLVQQTPFFALDVMRVLVDRIRKLDRELGIQLDP